jgi:hypothetical protein
METTKTHWKKLTNPNYIGSWDFEENEERIVIVKNVSKEVITNHEGKKEDAVLMEFETGLPLILNKTNLKNTEKALSTPIVEKWVGEKLTLYVDKNVKAFGSVVEGLRISPAKPKPVVKAGLNDERFEDALKAVKAGKFTPEQLKLKYTLTKEQIERL